jgi:hypothetical protein
MFSASCPVKPPRTARPQAELLLVFPYHLPLDYHPLALRAAALASLDRCGHRRGRLRSVSPTTAPPLQHCSSLWRPRRRAARTDTARSPCLRGPALWHFVKKTCSLHCGARLILHFPSSRFSARFAKNATGQTRFCTWSVGCKCPQEVGTYSLVASIRRSTTEVPKVGRLLIADCVMQCMPRLGQLLGQSKGSPRWFM